jgi:quercetin dioxygenase-like cupin family protein
MTRYRIDFDALPWQEMRPGVHQKTYCEGGRQIRLVEFSEAVGEPGWCESGHIGYVLAGRLQIAFREGETLSYGPGDGIFLPAGQDSAHKGVNIEPGTRLLMVEDNIE